MAQIFHPSFNTISRVSIFGSFFAVAGLAYLGYEFARSPYQTMVRVIREQPVQFSHDHHVSGLGIDCRYCHTSVEVSSNPGMPNTETCMSCHSQVWTDSPMLKPVRDSWETGVPIAWTKVHDLPDFVYFHHSVHVNKGVSCQTCHGEVNKMPLMWKEQPMTMEWCLDCHRNPGPRLGPVDRVFAFGDKSETAAGKALAEQILKPRADPVRDRFAQGSPLARNQDSHFAGLTNCSVCHR